MQRVHLGLSSAIVFCASAAWFAFFIPWNGFLDPDVFYHATIARLLAMRGPIREFPWLDLTLLGTSYADLHFGFHLLLIPFVKVFGLLHGARIAAVCFAAGAITAFYATLGWLRMRLSVAWVVLLLVSQPFVLRLLLGKATPLAIALFLVGLAAAALRRPMFVALIAAAYALSHGGWVILAGSVAILACGDILFSRIVENASWREAVRNSSWREAVAACAGGGIGLLLHPNFPAVFRFAWAQVFIIGIGTPFQRVNLGNEWLPSDPTWLIISMAPWIIAMLLGCAGLVFAVRPLPHPSRLPYLPRLVTSLGLIVAVLLALTLKSRRMIEFLIPATALWCAAIWSLVDVRKLFTAFAKPARALLVVCIVLVCAKQIVTIWTEFHPPRYRDIAYAETMNAITLRATPGDRVFHSSWDEFPILFLRDDRLRYISGLDPTFLAIASSTLSDRVREITCPECRNIFTNRKTSPIATSTWQTMAWHLIHDELGSRFIFVSKANHATMLGLVKSDPRYEQIFDGTDSSAFEISTTPPPSVKKEGAGGGSLFQ